MCAIFRHPTDIRCSVARRPTAMSSTPTKFAGIPRKARSMSTYGTFCSSIRRKLSTVHWVEAIIRASSRRTVDEYVRNLLLFNTPEALDGPLGGGNHQGIQPAAQQPLDLLPFQVRVHL